MSFRISVPRHKRDGARFVGNVSRALQQALVEEEKKRNLKQADIARTLGIDRSTVTRQIHGRQNMTLLRVGELASAMGRMAVISFPEETPAAGSNYHISALVTSASEPANVAASPLANAITTSEEPAI